MCSRASSSLAVLRAARVRPGYPSLIARNMVVPLPSPRRGWILRVALLGCLVVWVGSITAHLNEERSAHGPQSLDRHAANDAPFHASATGERGAGAVAWCLSQ
eukprot:scaffold994_cov226-Prasinococcus_capsulatus_cf.AAC.10